MTSDTVSALAEYLAGIDADWRSTSGYTGRPVHRKAYWRNMAARILADSVKAIAEPKKKNDNNPATGSK